MKRGSVIPSAFLAGFLVLASACSGGSGGPADPGLGDVDASGTRDVPGDGPGTDGTIADPSPDEAVAHDASPDDRFRRLPIGVSVDPVLGLGSDVVGVEVLDGRLPAGVFLGGDGRLWGRPVRAEDRAVRFRPIRSDGPAVDLELVLEVRGPTWAILPLEVPVAEAGQPWSAALEAVGASGTVTWTRVRGVLPTGIDLDPASGVLSGTPGETGLFPIQVRGTDGQGVVADLVTALRVGPEPLLATRAQAFEDAARDRMSPNGMLLSSWPDGRYADHADSGMWTGTFLAGMALKSSLNGDATMLARLLAGLAACREITGIAGLTCRGLEKDEWVGRTAGPNLVPDGGRIREATAPGYEGWRWVGDVSRDQWTGQFLGHTLAWALGGEAVRGPAATGMVSMALHLLDHGMEIHDVDGEITKYGYLSGWMLDGGIPSPNGVNAIMDLAWFSAAAQAAAGTADGDRLAAALADMLAPPPDGWDFLEDEGEYGYVEAIQQFLYPYLSSCDQRQWFNMNLTNDAFFNAVLRMPDGAVRDRLVGLWRDEMWVDQGDTPLLRRGGSEANPWFAWMYLGATAATDPDAAFEALQQMAAFPPPPRLAVEVSNSSNPAYPHDTDCPGWAFDALPTAERCSGTNFVWQKNPYELDCHGDVGQEYAGTDFVAPYWLGVAFGFVDPRW